MSLAGNSKAALLKLSPSDLFLPCNEPYNALGTLEFCRTQFENDWFKRKEASSIITTCAQGKMADSSSNNTSLWRGFHWNRDQRDWTSVEEFHKSEWVEELTGEGGGGRHRTNSVALKSCVLSPISWMKCWPQTIYHELLSLQDTWHFFLKPSVHYSQKLVLILPNSLPHVYT